MEEDAEMYGINNEYANSKCVCGDTILEPSSESLDVTNRREFISTIVTRTENYLRERRIPELIRFLFIKVIAHSPDKPVVFLEKLLDDCMLFRAGHGLPPVLYENRHLEAVIKSFDPGQRGWLSIGQVRRLYATLGLSYVEFTEEKVLCDVLMKNIKNTQENDLAQLLGTNEASNGKSDYLKGKKLSKK